MTPKEYVDDEGEDRARQGIREEASGMAQYLVAIGLVPVGVKETVFRSAIESWILGQCGLKSEVSP